MEENTIKLFELLNYKSFACKAKCQSEQPCSMYCNQFEQEVLATAIKQLQLKDKMILFLTKALIMQYKIQDLPFISFKIANKELEKKINKVIGLVKQQALAELEE